MHYGACVPSFENLFSILTSPKVLEPDSRAELCTEHRALVLETSGTLRTSSHPRCAGGGHAPHHARLVEQALVSDVALECRSLHRHGRGEGCGELRLLR